MKPKTPSGVLLFTTILCALHVSAYSVSTRRVASNKTQDAPSTVEPRPTYIPVKRPVSANAQTPTASTSTPPPQNAPVEITDDTALLEGIEHFSLEMLQQLSEGGSNIAFSPLTTWVQLALMSEGASEVTLEELRQVLHLPSSYDTLHRVFGRIHGEIQKSSGNQSSLNIGSAIFSSPFRTLSRRFENIAEAYYNAALYQQDFRNNTQAARAINEWVFNLTKGQISAIVDAADLKDAEFVLTSALYFRGAWKHAFNASETKSEPFFDDAGNKLSDVQMMYQSGLFRMSFVENLSCLALELPYAGGRNSMLLLLPRRGSNLAEMMEGIAGSSRPLVKYIMDKLREDAETDDECENIHVYLPRFDFDSQVKLKPVLRKMGVRALFQAGRQELAGISRNLYVTQMYHKAAINVTEEGTVAAAASASVLHNYSLPSTFKGNHPFLFLIVQKATNTILFAGKVGNPSPAS